MKRTFAFLIIVLAASLGLAQAQTFKFDFTSDKKVEEGYVKVTPETLFNSDQGFGYDIRPAWDGKGNNPFFFSVNVPDGN